MTMTGMMREYPQSVRNLPSCGTFPPKGRLPDVPLEMHSTHVQLGRADPGPIHPRNAWMLSRRSWMRDGHGAPSEATVQTRVFPFHSFFPTGRGKVAAEASSQAAGEQPGK